MRFINSIEKYDVLISILFYFFERCRKVHKKYFEYLMVVIYHFKIHSQSTNSFNHHKYIKL